MNRERVKHRFRQNQPIVQRSERLEDRLAFSLSPATDSDDAELTNNLPHAPRSSCNCPGCNFVVPAEIRMASATAQAQFPLSETFKLHSLPNATKRIYLDFDGHLTVNTLWQTSEGHGPIDTPAFSLDADYSSFTDVEKETIQDVWTRVSEDFAPFEIDVTTEDPGIAALANTGGSDTAWGIRVVVGGNGAWNGAAGVAFLGGFGDSGGAPAFAFADQAWKRFPNIIATAVSHEVGHTLGLRHDGYNGSEYYEGRGTGPTSWGPLMGNPDKSLTQWSKGDYGGATRTEDDLAIITTRPGNGFGYRVDDHGNTLNTATNPVNDATKGIIERNDDQDVFRFITSGTIKATINPLATGANLDVLAEILDSTGVVIATSNPIGRTDASFEITVNPGTYFLRIQGTGEGDPLQTGYTKYGSLGQYTVTIQNVIPPPRATISDIVVTEGNLGETLATFTISLSSPASQQVSLAVATQDGTATTLDNDYYDLPAGTKVIFPAGQTRQTVQVRIRGDRKFEANETFSVVLSSPEGVVIGDATGVGSIINDDADVPTVSVSDTRIREGQSGTSVVRATVNLSKPSTSDVTVFYRTLDGTATVSNSDYVAVRSGTQLVFRAGETRRTIDVQIIGDSVFEADETFRIELQDARGAIVDSVGGLVTIENDDRDPATLPNIHLLPSAVVEASGSRTMAEFVVAVSGQFSKPFWLTYATADGTAKATSDYTATTGSVKVLPGEREKRIWVAVTGDRELEADEYFTLTVRAAEVSELVINNPLAGRFGLLVNQTRAYIVDDDSRSFTVRANAASVYEGDTASFTADLRRAPGFGSILLPNEWLAGLTPQATASLLRKIRFEVFFMAGNALPIGSGGRPVAPPSRESLSGKAEFGYVTGSDGSLRIATTRQFDVVTARTASSAKPLASSRTLLFELYGGLQAGKPAASATTRVVPFVSTAAQSRTR
jgi:hypothetical protein